MTDETLRDLLEERVADLAARDLAAPAWSEGVRRRRARRTIVLAGVAAVTALVVGAAVLVGGPGPDDPPPSERPTSAEPEALVQGAHVWWSPDLAEEAALPQVAGPLPEQVDLDEEAPEAAGTTGPPALAAFAVLDGSRADHLLLVGDGPARSLDLSRLDAVAKPNGYRLPPVSRSMLSPDGRTLAFGQDGAIAFFDLTLGKWREVPVDGPTHDLTWAGPRLLVLANGDGLSVDGRPVDLDQPRLVVLGMIDPATPQGPWSHSADGLADAQAFGYGAQVPTRPGYAQQPETVVVQDTAAPDVLAISSEPNDGRFKDCCPVAGWLDGDTVVYESRSAEPRLVSWDVGTRTFGRVTTIVGGAAPDASYVGSYAQLDVQHAGTSTPEPTTGEPDTVAGGRSPDGGHVLFVQDRSVEVYDVAAATWTTIPTPAWGAEAARWWRPGVIALRAGATYGADGTPLGQHDVAESSLAREGDAAWGPVVRAEGVAGQAMRLAPGGRAATSSTPRPWSSSATASDGRSRCRSSGGARAAAPRSASSTRRRCCSGRADGCWPGGSAATTSSWSRIPSPRGPGRRVWRSSPEAPLSLHS